jgi:hypothetical protein
MLRLAGFVGDEAKIPKLLKMMMVEDATALRVQLLDGPGSNRSNAS